MTGGPIVFLNPAVLIDRLGPVWINGEQVHGIRTAPPLPNGSVDRLNEMFATIGGGVVLIDLDRMGDVRTRLARIGFRAAYHAAWHTDPDAADTGAGIGAWIAEHGSPPHLVIDQIPGTDAVAARLIVPPGREVPAAGIATLIAAISTPSTMKERT